MGREVERKSESERGRDMERYRERGRERERERGEGGGSERDGGGGGPPSQTLRDCRRMIGPGSVIDSVLKYKTYINSAPMWWLQIAKPCLAGEAALGHRTPACPRHGHTGQQKDGVGHAGQ